MVIKVFHFIHFAIYTWDGLENFESFSYLKKNNMLPENESHIPEPVSIFLGIFLWILISPILLFVYLPFLILKYSHHFLASIFCPDLIPIKTWQDNIYSIKPSSESPKLNGIQIWKLEGKLDLEEFKAHFHTLFLSTAEKRRKYVNFLCYLVKWGLYVFRKPVAYKDFNLSSHIKRYNGEKLDSEEKFANYISEWVQWNRPEGQPNWDILIMDGYEAEGETILLLKSAHSLMDGYTGVHLIDMLCGKETMMPREKNKHSFFKMLKFYAMYPKHILAYLISQVQSKPFPLPGKVLDHSAIKENWWTAWTSLDLPKLKEIRKRTNTHFNTILGTIQVGAMREYFLDTNGVKPEELSPWCWLPFPSFLANHPSMTEGGTTGMCNHHTFTFIQFPVRESNPASRLSAAESSFEYGESFGFQEMWNHIFGPVLMYAFPQPIFVWITENLRKLRFYSAQQSLTALVIGNEERKLLGLRLRKMLLVVLLPDFYCSTHFYVVPSTYNGRMDITILGSRKLFPTRADIESFTKEYMHREVDKLYNAVVNK